MASPVKTSAPSALDRGDRFGGEGSLAAPGLPMPGLSGRANSPTAPLQATSSRDPLTTTESSRAPPSWLASSLTSRPRSTSPPASAVTSSWGFTKCSCPQQPQSPSHSPTSSDSDALIPGVYFLGGNTDEKEDEFQFGNIRVHLKTSTQGCLFGAGRESVSILRITLRFTIDFENGEDFCLGMKNGCNEKKNDGDWDEELFGKKSDQEDKAGAGKPNGERWPIGDLDGQQSLSLSLTMSITIMAINSPSLY
ncbi:hypothetical protein F4808DRAFT_193836 [Astrocystis sublimbata]|nr:hypothetical protein F4808DRAFT_193836 [Astrocystis sublimbata]